MVNSSFTRRSTFVEFMVHAHSHVGCDTMDSSEIYGQTWIIQRTWTAVSTLHVTTKVLVGTLWTKFSSRGWGGHLSYYFAEIDDPKRMTTYYLWQYRLRDWWAQKMEEEYFPKCVCPAKFWKQQPTNCGCLKALTSQFNSSFMNSTLNLNKQSL